jgi:hypothetical protein
MLDTVQELSTNSDRDRSNILQLLRQIGGDGKVFTLDAIRSKLPQRIARSGGVA